MSAFFGQRDYAGVHDNQLGAGGLGGEDSPLRRPGTLGRIVADDHDAPAGLEVEVGRGIAYPESKGVPDGPAPETETVSRSEIGCAECLGKTFGGAAVDVADEGLPGIHDYSPGAVSGFDALQLPGDEGEGFIPGYLLPTAAFSLQRTGQTLIGVFPFQYAGGPVAQPRSDIGGGRLHFHDTPVLDRYAHAAAREFRLQLVWSGMGLGLARLRREIPDWPSASDPEPTRPAPYSSDFTFATILYLPHP